MQIQWLNTAINPTTNTGYLLMMLPVRVVFAIDRMPPLVSQWAENTTFPPSGDASIVDTGAYTNPTYYNTQAPYNINTHGTRFHILKDEVICPGEHAFPLYGNNGSSVATGCMANYNWYLEPKCISTWFDTSSGNILENAILMWVMCDNTANTTTYQQVPKYQTFIDCSYAEKESQ